MCMVNPLAACALVIDSLSSFQWTKRKGDGARNLHLGSLYRILSRILATKNVFVAASSLCYPRCSLQDLQDLSHSSQSGLSDSVRDMSEMLQQHSRGEEETNGTLEGHAYPKIVPSHVFLKSSSTIGRNIFSLVTCRLLLTCLGADAERIENVIVHPLSRQSWRPRESHIPASRSSHHEDRPLFLCRAIFFEKHASHRRTQNPLTGGGGAGPSYLPSSSGNVGQAELARCCWVSSVYEVCISDHERAVSMHEWHSPPIQPW